MKCVGIDIGSSSVKIAEVEVNQRGHSITNFREFAFNPDPNHDPRIDIIDIIRNAISGFDHANTKFIFSVPQNVVSVKHKIFPFKERQKILKSLPFELEDDTPLDQDDAIFDAKMIAHDGINTEVLACLCPKEQVKRILDIAKDCGIDPEIIGVEGLAFANLFEDFLSSTPERPPLSDDEKESTSITVTDVVEAPMNLKPAELVVHMGHTHTILLALVDKRIVAVRSVHWGAKQLTDSVAKKYKITYLEALREVQKKSFILTKKEGATKDQIAFSETIADSLEPLARDVRITMMSISSFFKLEFKKTHLLGGPALIKNIGPFFTQRLEVASNPYRLFQTLGTLGFASDAQMEMVAGPAIALALEGIKKPRNPAINLRKLEFARQNLTFQKYWERWGYASQLGSAALLLLFVYSFLRDDFALNLADTSNFALKKTAKEVGGLTGRNAGMAQINRFINTEQKRIEGLEKLSKVQDMNSALDIIKKISDVLPKKNQVQLDISTFDIDNDSVTLAGRVKDNAQLELIKSALTTQAVSGKIKVNENIVDAATQSLRFQISFNVNRNFNGSEK